MNEDKISPYSNDLNKYIDVLYTSFKVWLSKTFADIPLVPKEHFKQWLQLCGLDIMNDIVYGINVIDHSDLFDYIINN